MKILIKTTCILIAMFLSGTSINAQEKPIRFGVKAGLTYSGQYEKSRIGFNTGITLDFRLYSDLYLLTGLEFEVRNGKGNPYYDAQENAIVTSTNRPQYLQLPIHIGYQFSFDNIKIMPHAGFFYSYGVGGDVYWKYKYDDGRPEKTVKWEFFGNNDVKRADYGVGFGAGIEFSKFVLDFRYDFGLRNTAKAFDGDKVNTGHLTLGYKF